MILSSGPSSLSPGPDDDNTVVCSTRAETRRDDGEENWVARRIREAYGARERRLCNTPAYAFYAEVSRWCARRLDEVRVHYPPPSQHVTPGGGAEDGEGEGDDESLDAEEPYAVEEDIREAFWEEMRRLTGTGTGASNLNSIDSSGITGVESA